MRGHEGLTTRIIIVELLNVMSSPTAHILEAVNGGSSKASC